MQQCSNVTRRDDSGDYSRLFLPLLLSHGCLCSLHIMYIPFALPVVLVWASVLVWWRVAVAVAGCHWVCCVLCVDCMMCI
jgi:hypothetical protein